MKRPEEALQRRVVQFLRLAKPDCVWFHVPNGGRRSATEAAIFKAMGVRAGVSDLIFLWTGGCGVIELKADEGRLTPHQCAFLAECRALRIPFFVARSVEEVETTLRIWGRTLKASVLPSSAGDTAPTAPAGPPLDTPQHAPSASPAVSPAEAGSLRKDNER